MEKYFDEIRTVGLFKGIIDSDLKTLLNCLKVEVISAVKNEFVMLAGNKPQHIGIVLSGQLYIVKEEYDGHRSIVAAVTPGEIYGEALCFAGVDECPVTVIAETDSIILLIRYNGIMNTCTNSCGAHIIFNENFLGLMANKILYLRNRMEIIGLKSVRAKVLRYLDSFAKKQRTNITIPFNREELADYLCVERTALSHELSKMKKDGLIDYWKNHFSLRT